MGLTGFIARLRQAGISLASSVEEQITFGGANDDDVVASPAVLGSLHLSSPTLAATYLHSIYPTLKRHYEWFRRTQRGSIRQFGRKARSSSEAYRWRGRTAEHGESTASYPRIESRA